MTGTAGSGLSPQGRGFIHRGSCSYSYFINETRLRGQKVSVAKPGELQVCHIHSVPAQSMSRVPEGRGY